MVDFDKLQDELYTLKVLIELVNKYMENDSEKLGYITLFASRDGCLPGRAVSSAFAAKKMNDFDKKVIQEIVNIYG